MSDFSFNDFGEYQNRVALCIGINYYSRYEHLRYAVSDAEVVSKVLRDFGGFEVTTLTDARVPTQKVTLTQIEKGINWLFKQAESKNTLLLLYFSGHAAQTPTGQLYLLPGDVKVEKEAVGHFDAFKFEEIRNFIEKTHAGALLVFLDTCYSGASSFLPRGASIPLNFKVHMIGASQVDQKAKESPQAQHGAFTHYLLEAFQFLSPNKGWIDSDQIETYIKTESKIAKWPQEVWRFAIGGSIPVLKEGYQGQLPKFPIESPFIPNLDEFNIAETFWQGDSSLTISQRSLDFDSRPIKYVNTKEDSYSKQESYTPKKPLAPYLLIIGIVVLFFLALFGTNFFGAFSNTEIQIASSPTPIFVARASSTPSDSIQVSNTSESDISLLPLANSNTSPTTSRIYAAAFIPNSTNKFVAIAEDGTVSKWSLESSGINLEASTRITEPVNSKLPIFSKALSVAPDGKSVAVAKTNGFSIVDLQNGLKTIVSSKIGDEHRARVEGISFSPDGKKLVTVSSDRLIKVWDVSKLDVPKLLTNIQGQASYSVTFVDNNTIATGDGDGKIRIWDINTKKDISPVRDGIPMHKGSWAYWIAFAPGQYQGNRLVVSVSGFTKDTTPSPSQTPEVKLTLLPLTNVSQSFQSTTVINQPLVPQALADSQQQAEWMYSTAFSPDGNLLAVAYGSGSVKVWDISKLALLKDEPVKSNNGGKRVTAMAFSSDGQWLVAGNDKGEVFVWKVDPAHSLPNQPALTPSPSKY